MMNDPSINRVLKMMCGVMLIISVSHASSFAQQPTPVVTRAARTERGIKLYEKGKNSEAIENLLKAVKEDMMDAEAWHYLGLAYAKDRDLPNGIQAFTATVHLRPNYAPSHLAFANLYFSENSYAGAAKEATATLSLDPASHRAHYILGIIALRTGDPATALKEADATLGLQPNFGPALVLKTTVLVNQFVDFTEAKEHGPVEPAFRSLREAEQTAQTFLRLYATDANAPFIRTQLETIQAYLAGDSELWNLSSLPANGSPSVITKAKITSRPKPEISGFASGAVASSSGGTVRLRVRLAADGTVKDILVLQPMEYGLTERSIAAAKRIKFTPATINGKPVSEFRIIEYHFRRETGPF